MKYIGKSAGTLATLIFISDVIAAAAPPWEISATNPGFRPATEIRIPTNAGRGQVIQENPNVRTHPLISTRRAPVINVDSIRSMQIPAGKPSK